MAKLVSNVYGDALFDLAVETSKIDAFLEEAKDINGVLKTNPELSQMMNHPKISKEEKLQIIENVFKGKISDEIVGLLVMIVEKDHWNDVESVFEYFINRVYEYKNIGTATVSTPVELTEAQKASVEKRLLETTQYVSFNIDYKIDPELIGGMVIRIGDKVVDSSIKTQLQKLTRELSNIQLKVGECAQ